MFIKFNEGMEALIRLAAITIANDLQTDITTYPREIDTRPRLMELLSSPETPINEVMRSIQAVEFTMGAVSQNVRRVADFIERITGSEV